METARNIITGLSLMWLLPLSIITTDIIVHNIKLGILKERHKK